MLHQIADAELHHTGPRFFSEQREYLGVSIYCSTIRESLRRLAKGRRRRLERPGATYGTYLPYRLRPVHARTPARRSPHRLVN